MSIRIPCPHCGTRPVEEFVYGEVPVVPDEIQTLGREAADFDFGFMRNNPEGVQREAWFHSYGCRRWVYVLRDTVTDTVIGPAP